MLPRIHDRASRRLAGGARPDVAGLARRNPETTAFTEEYRWNGWPGWLERDLPKRRILEIYLNVVELGPGIYGAEAGARRYFGKSAASLSFHEAAALAASLPYPERWHPGSRSRSYLWRVRLIERRMSRSLGLRSEL